MHEDDDIDFAIREARDRGDFQRVRQIERERAQREKEKEKLKLDVLKQQMQQDDVPAADRTMVTMTREEEAKANILTAQDKATPEQQIRSERQQQQNKKDTPEYQQDLG